MIQVELLIRPVLMIFSTLRMDDDHPGRDLSTSSKVGLEYSSVIGDVRPRFTTIFYHGLTCVADSRVSIRAFYPTIREAKKAYNVV